MIQNRNNQTHSFTIVRELSQVQFKGSVEAPTREGYHFYMIIPIDDKLTDEETVTPE